MPSFDDKHSEFIEVFVGLLRLVLWKDRDKLASCNGLEIWSVWWVKGFPILLLVPLQFLWPWDRTQVILFEFTPNGAVTGTAQDSAKKKKRRRFGSGLKLGNLFHIFLRDDWWWCERCWICPQDLLGDWGVQHSYADLFLHTVTPGIEPFRFYSSHLVMALVTLSGRAVQDFERGIARACAKLHVPHVQGMCVAGVCPKFLRLSLMFFIFTLYSLWLMYKSLGSK